MTKNIDILKNYTILYVEDDELTRQNISEILHIFFKEVYEACDGLDGLEQYDTHKPDMIVTDISMPNMDGLSMVKEIRQTNKNIPIIIMSAYSDEDNLFRAIHLGITGYLVKPLIKDKFVNVLIENAMSISYQSYVSQENRFLKDVINNVDDVVVVIDDNHNVKLLNENAKMKLKVEDIADVNRLKCYELIKKYNKPCDKLNQPCPLNIVSSENKDAEVTHIYNKNNSLKHFDLSAKAYYNESDEFEFIVETLHDMTTYLENIDNLSAQNEVLDFKAHYDSLTNLPNRELFLDRLHQSITFSNRNNNKFALLFTDIDRFKEFNDIYNHTIGDKVLSLYSNILTNIVRENDTVARLGGDEFVILLNNIKQEDDIKRFCDELKNKTQEPFEIDGIKINLSVSVGIAIYPDSTTAQMELLQKADQAMYVAKKEDNSKFSYHIDNETP